MSCVSGFWISDAGFRVQELWVWRAEDTSWLWKCMCLNRLKSKPYDTKETSPEAESLNPKHSLNPKAYSSNSIPLPLNPNSTPNLRNSVAEPATGPEPCLRKPRVRGRWDPAACARLRLWGFKTLGLQGFRAIGLQRFRALGL